jgi:hypothetical protein
MMTKRQPQYPHIRQFCRHARMLRADASGSVLIRNAGDTS